MLLSCRAPAALQRQQRQLSCTARAPAAALRWRWRRTAGGAAQQQQQLRRVGAAAAEAAAPAAADPFPDLQPGDELPEWYGEFYPDPYPPRRAGVILHPTSLPGPYGTGEIGAEALKFVDWLAASGMQLWQVRRARRAEPRCFCLSSRSSPPLHAQEQSLRSCFTAAACSQNGRPATPLRLVAAACACRAAASKGAEAYRASQHRPP